MFLLARSYSPGTLNTRGFSLYADFRPKCEGWGARAEMRCDTILALRKEVPEESADEKLEGSVLGNGKVVNADLNAASVPEKYLEDEPASKKVKEMTVEEYEAALDSTLSYEDLAYDDF